MYNICIIKWLIPQLGASATASDLTRIDLDLATDSYSMLHLSLELSKLSYVETPNNVHLQLSKYYIMYR